MKVENRIFLGLLIFYLPIGLLYGYLTHWNEPVGLISILFLVGMTGMISFYIVLTARKLDERPEDNPEAEIAEGEGDYGFFSPHSWWPLFVGLSAAVVFLAVAIPNAWWLFLFGVVAGVCSLVGWTFEYFSGEHSL